MKPDPSRVLAAIRRNFAEADTALLTLTAYRSLRHAQDAGTDVNFFTIARRALYNDVIAGAIRIFDDHKEAGSLWYIIRCHDAAAQKAAHACGIDLGELRKLVPALRYVRNKTHFHIDRRALETSASIWRDAGISDDALADALRDTALLLARLKQDVYGGDLDTLTAYDGADVKRMIDACAADERR